MKEISHFIKKKIRYLSNLLDPILDFRNLNDNNPDYCSKFANNKKYIINVPLNKIRHFRLLGFSCSTDSLSPFIQTLKAYALGQCTHYDNSPLKEYYNVFQPSNVAEIMGIDGPDVNEQLLNTDPLGEIPVWSKGDYKKQVNIRIQQIKEDCKANGAEFKTHNGDGFFGPVSPPKGCFEFNRLINVYKNIKEHGYIMKKFIHSDLIIGRILKNENDWKCWITNGQHRISALVVLGYKEVPVVIQNKSRRGVINRKEAGNWPNVKAKLITKEQALMVFDRIFYAQPIPSMKKWIEEMKRRNL